MSLKEIGEEWFCMFTKAARRERGRPPKNSTQEAASNGQVSQAPAFTQTSRTGLRSKTKK